MQKKFTAVESPYLTVNTKQGQRFVRQTRILTLVKTLFIQ